MYSVKGTKGKREKGEKVEEDKELKAKKDVCQSEKEMKEHRAKDKEQKISQNFQSEAVNRDLKKTNKEGRKVIKVIVNNIKKINENMAKNRNIDFYAARQGENKKSFLPTLETVYSVKRAEILYVGDDLFDKDIMLEVGHKYCPQDACPDILDICGT